MFVCSVASKSESFDVGGDSNQVSENQLGIFTPDQVCDMVIVKQYGLESGPEHCLLDTSN